jgi:hypothetical protein
MILLEGEREKNDNQMKANLKPEEPVERVKYLEAIISKELLVENSDDYVMACLSHYELSKIARLNIFK